jgi:dihydrofolate reductase
MPVLHAIVAMSENRAIAYEGKMPWHLPLEYRWFKHKTMGGAMIMGRKTFEAIGKPLPGRTSFVLSRQAAAIPGAKCYFDLEALTADLPKDQPSWVVGGAEIYHQFLPACTFLYLSRIKKTTPGDIFFPPFEDTYALNQVIHENDDFRVERWLRQGEGAEFVSDPWPFHDRF